MSLCGKKFSNKLYAVAIAACFIQASVTQAMDYITPVVGYIPPATSWLWWLTTSGLAGYATVNLVDKQVPGVNAKEKAGYLLYQGLRPFKHAYDNRNTVTDVAKSLWDNKSTLVTAPTELAGKAAGSCVKGYRDIVGNNSTEIKVEIPEINVPKKERELPQEPIHEPVPEVSKAVWWKNPVVIAGGCAVAGGILWYLYKYIRTGHLPLLYRSKPELTALNAVQVEALLKLYRDQYLLKDHTPEFVASVKTSLSDEKVQQLAQTLGISSAQEVQNFIGTLESSAVTQGSAGLINDAIIQEVATKYKKIA